MENVLGHFATHGCPHQVIKPQCIRGCHTQSIFAGKRWQIPQNQNKTTANEAAFVNLATVFFVLAMPYSMLTLVDSNRWRSRLQFGFCDLRVFIKDEQSADFESLVDYIISKHTVHTTRTYRVFYVICTMKWGFVCARLKFTNAQDKGYLF